MSNDQKPVKIHLGCGDRKLEGWINIDSVKEFKPDVVHDLANPLPYADLTVDEVLAEGRLEHFDKYARFPAFYDWTRILKVGGEITVLVPDFPKIMTRYFKFGFDGFVDFLFGENMFRSEVYIGHFGNHKFGYSDKSFKEFVKLFGIETVNIEKKNLNLILHGKKTRHVSSQELDSVQIHSRANACGIGKPDLPLSFVKQKIRVFQELQDSKAEV